jgi:hypothetical protein
MTTLKNHPDAISDMKQLNDMVCTFCNAKIEYGKSVCDACAKKFNIGKYDMGSNGCGCDG